MRKIWFPIVILNTLLTIAAIVLFTFTYLQCKNLHELPYGMNGQSTVFSISENVNSNLLPLDNARIKKIVGQIKDIAEKTNITIVNNNISNMGLGVFDSRGKYMDPSNAASLLDTLAQNSILLRTESYYDGQKSIETLSGKRMSVAGRYDENYALYDKDHEYIYNFFSDQSLGGDFYLECDDQTSIQKIITLFEENNFKVTLKNKSNLSFTETVRSLFSYTLYAATVLGFAFIIFNLGLFYFSYFENFKKRMKLHMIYGARFKSLVLSYTDYFLLNDLLAVMISFILYALIFKNSNLFLPMPYLLVAVPAAFVFNALLFLTCIFFKFSLRPKNLLS